MRFTPLAIALGATLAYAAPLPQQKGLPDSSGAAMSGRTETSQKAPLANYFDMFSSSDPKYKGQRVDSNKRSAEASPEAAAEANPEPLAAANPEANPKANPAADPQYNMDPRKGRTETNYLGGGKTSDPIMSTWDVMSSIPPPSSLGKREAQYAEDPKSGRTEMDMKRVAQPQLAHWDALSSSDPQWAMKPPSKRSVSWNDWWMCLGRIAL